MHHARYAFGMAAANLGPPRPDPKINHTIAASKKISGFSRILPEVSNLITLIKFLEFLRSSRKKCNEILSLER